MSDTDPTITIMGKTYPSGEVEKALAFAREGGFRDQPYYAVKWLKQHGKSIN